MKKFMPGVDDASARSALQAFQSLLRGLGLQPGVDMSAGIDAGAALLAAGPECFLCQACFLD
jgi:hypothetical protein